ncbi:hypothetical protein ALI144C_31145 [Actinosynnema sp. ALI-1.44]|uniref:hypothetical protein n=1 Tax=Actinosynnema sp. ALI-1.44 TaxID=1933779 RepID=UPI00097C2D64|nr:hypothetical protein [Actinosynnema sp. ALI-1.44]ONI77871.1 hypothetical protein ALI144C_31145 [Actinosynnema sp. ALI-1.44]
MTNRPANTEDRLRETLDAVANGVRPTPDAYRHARREWIRRERRRRIILAILVALVFAVADAIGLWALNQTPDTPTIFNDPIPVRQNQPPRPSNWLPRP